jgi:hypothetical protein
MTVTSSVSFSVPIVPDSPNDPMELKRQPSEAYPTVTDHFVGPHGKIGIDAISLVAKALEEMAERRSDFYVYGTARYNDQFADTSQRSTKFCFVVRPFKGPNGLSLNNHGLCHHWNCGDEDCDRDKRNYEMERMEVLKQNPKAVEVKPTARALASSRSSTSVAFSRGTPISSSMLTARSARGKG